VRRPHPPREEAIARHGADGSGRFDADIKKDIADAGSAGISGTPTFLVGIVQPADGHVKVARKLVGAKPYTEFKAAVDSVLTTAR
jgi:protein-disulfide isomerase